MKKFTLLFSAVVLSLITLSASAKNDNVDTQKKEVNEISISENLEQPIDINQADEDTLASLKGIGVKRAKAIIAYRDSHGKFKAIEDLLKIKGIGKGFLSKNKHRLVI